jgi:hypothetical protein
MITAIDIIAQEKVARVRALATDSEELLEIKELAVDVPADCNRRAQELDVGFLLEKFGSFLEKRREVGFLRDLALRQNLREARKTGSAHQKLRAFDLFPRYEN